MVRAVLYRLAAETFARLNVPIYYVNGNHDTASGIRRHLPMGPKEDAAGAHEPGNLGPLSYTFEVKGYRFLVLEFHSFSIWLSFHLHNLKPR